MQVVFAIAIVGPIFSITRLFAVHYLPFDEVRDLISTMVNAGAPDVPSGDFHGAASWNSWIHAWDREIRGRTDRGIEESISNLILFGTSYSQLLPIPTYADGEDPSRQLTPADFRMPRENSGSPCKRIPTATRPTIIVPASWARVEGLQTPFPYWNFPYPPSRASSRFIFSWVRAMPRWGSFPKPLSICRRLRRWSRTTKTLTTKFPSSLQS